MLHAEVCARWERLAADPAALELLRWRHERCSSGALRGEAGAGDRLRGELDALIAERAGGGSGGQAAMSPASKRRRLGASDARAGWQRPEPSAGTAPCRSLLGQLGLDAARMPSPLLTFLELWQAEGPLSDAQASDAFRSWASLSVPRQRALWAVVAHGAELQDKAIAAALHEVGCPAEVGAGAPRGGAATSCVGTGGAFARFLAEQGPPRGRRGGVASKASWVMTMQRDFFELPEDELTARCLSAPLPWELLAGSSCGDQEPGEPGKTTTPQKDPWSGGWGTPA